MGDMSSMIGSGRISGNVTLNAALTIPQATEKQIRAAIEQADVYVSQERKLLC